MFAVERPLLIKGLSFETGTLYNTFSCTLNELGLMMMALLIV